LYGIGVVELDEDREDEQLASIVAIKDVTVVLSARRWNEVLDEFEMKLAWVIAPPGRLELFGSPYCQEKKWWFGKLTLLQN
jgi:hypothetical protein